MSAGIVTVPPCPLPTGEAVKDTLATLLGTGVSVSMAEPSAAMQSWVAAYERDTGVLAAACQANRSMAMRAAAAMLELPPEELKDALKRGDDEALRESFNEIVNVFSRLLNSENTPPVRLREVHEPGDELPSDVDALLRYPASQRHFDVRIDEYGLGQLGFLIW